WNQNEIDWSSVLAATEDPIPESVAPRKIPVRAWQAGLASMVLNYAPRAAALLGLFLVLWFARELYLGGPIPFLRVPEKFVVDPTPLDDTWPAPMDGSEGPIRL
ncbi:MAG TPA: hypothetical protein VEC99_04675, partial [Clostridia bacterium]|nr:hypothetical protein [Clostridia bacterium]